MTDPRNKDAFEYILKRIKEAGYYATPLILNSYDFGVVQNRIRVYIVGFKDKKYFDLFRKPNPVGHNLKLFNVLNDINTSCIKKAKFLSSEIYGDVIPSSRTRFQKEDEVNDFFLFNDIRNGHSTIHSWDLIETTDLEKKVCYALLQNRRKKLYGKKDGNPLSFDHLKDLASEFNKNILRSLLRKNIFKKVAFTFEVNLKEFELLNKGEQIFIKSLPFDRFDLNDINSNLKLYSSSKLNWRKIIDQLELREIIKVIEYRYDFKNSKISSGINGINRVYLPNSDVYSTLVASDTNDFIATDIVRFNSPEEYKREFIKQIIKENKYRKISKEEACKIQGFPEDF